MNKRLPTLGVLIAMGVMIIISELQSNLANQVPNTSGNAFNNSLLGPFNYPIISSFQAYEIIRFNTIIESTYGQVTINSSGKDPNQELFERLKKTDSYNDLLRSAKLAVDQDLINGKAISKTLPNWSSASEESHVAEECLRLLVRAANDFSRATATQSLSQIAEAKSTLEVLHGDLSSICNARNISFTNNPYDLLDASVLTAIDSHLRTYGRRLEEMYALTSDPQAQGLLNEFQSIRSNIKKALLNTGFEVRKRQVLSQIPDSDYRKESIDQESRIKQKTTNRIRELSELTGNPEMLLLGAPTLGPPESWAFSVVSDYDSSPTQWCENYAKLTSLGDAMVADDICPSSIGATSPLRRGLSTLDDDTLQILNRQTKSLLESKPLLTPLLNGQRGLLNELVIDTTSEVERRRSVGGAKIKIDHRMLDMTVPPPSERYKARLVDVIFDRWEKPETRPPALQDEYKSILEQSVATYGDKLQEHIATCSGIINKAILSSSVVPENTLESIKALRRSVYCTACEFDYFAGKVSDSGIPVSYLRKKIAVALALFPKGPPAPPATDPTSVGTFLGAAPSDRGGWAAKTDWAKVLSQEKVLPHSYKLEHDLTKLDYLETQLTAELRQIQTNVDVLPAASPFIPGSDHHRLIATEAGLVSKDFNPAKVQQSDDSRLPDGKRYMGLLDDNGRPYDYETVKHPKNFKGVPGGILLGAKAEPSEKTDLSSAILTYEPTKGLLFRDGVTGHEWIVDNCIDPTSLRAIYRFVAAGRNAAVSIGWNGQHRSIEEEATRIKILDGIRYGTSTVYLDPYLIDTQIGQQLVMADSIPWRLDKLVNRHGKTLSLSKAFSDSTNLYRESLSQKIKGTLLTVVKPIDQDHIAIKNFLHSLGTSPSVDTLGVDISKTWYVNECFNGLCEDKLKESNKSLDGSFSRCGRRNFELLFPDQSSIDVEEQLGETYSDAVSEWKSENKGKDFQDEVEKEIVISSLSQREFPNRSLVDEWVSEQMANGRSKKDIIDQVISFINPTTLALLYDDAVTFHLGQTNVSINVNLKYLYATSHVTINDTFIGLGPDETGSEVETISGLTNMVNKALPEIIDAAPSLQMIRRYAGIAAILRWAQESSGTDLGMLDLSELAGVSPNDRVKSPTIDEIIRKLD